MNGFMSQPQSFLLISLPTNMHNDGKNDQTLGKQYLILMNDIQINIKFS